MSKLEILKAIVPDLVAAMKTTLKSDQSEYFDRSRELVLLIARMNSTYPREVLQAAFLVAYIRFQRWSKDYEKVLQIKEALALESNT
jgi:hypothetical protein